MGDPAQSQGFLTKLVERREVADGTMAFLFEKPDGWTFKAGQFIEIGLINPTETDSEGNSRAFSIASAPNEAAIMVATRMRDTAFKRVLKTLPIGTEVKIEGPFGDLTLHNNARRPAILLAGGIGITPFRSIVMRAAKEKLPHSILLFYSNRHKEDAPFLKELAALEKVNANFKLVPTMTQMENARLPWEGERGLINQAMITKHVKAIPTAEPTSLNPIFYIAGPPGLVTGLRAMLHESGVDDDDIRAEDFSGY